MHALRKKIKLSDLDFLILFKLLNYNLLLNNSLTKAYVRNNYFSNLFYTFRI